MQSLAHFPLFLPASWRHATGCNAAGIIRKKVSCKQPQLHVNRKSHLSAQRIGSWQFAQAQGILCEAQLNTTPQKEERGHERGKRQVCKNAAIAFFVTQNAERDCNRNTFTAHVGRNEGGGHEIMKDPSVHSLTTNKKKKPNKNQPKKKEEKKQKQESAHRATAKNKTETSEQEPGKERKAQQTETSPSSGGTSGEH